MSVDWLARPSCLGFSHCGTIALWHGTIALWYHCTIAPLHRLVGQIVQWHFGTIALWQGPVGLLALWHCGTMEKNGLEKLWYGLVGLLALWDTPLQGLVGQFALWHYGKSLLGRSHTVADWVPAPTSCANIQPENCAERFAKIHRGEKLKPGAQLTETLTQHGTTEVKLSPGVGSVVLEEHLEGSSPCRLKSRSAPNLPHRVQLLAAHAHSLVQRSHARTLRVPRHHSQRLSVPFRAPGPAEPCGVEVVGRRAKVPREPVVDSRGRRGSCTGSHVRRPACRLSSTSQPHLAPLPSSHLHQKPLSLVVSLSRVD